MPVKITVDPSLDVPIYVQLVDMIRSQIRSGRIAFGEKLPTVREMGERCGIAPGTVTRAYAELENFGFIQKKIGKGTFACWKNEEQYPGRKEAALAAIDRMLDEMDRLCFSPAETGIYLGLKLRERHGDTPPVRIAVVEQDDELLYQLNDGLSLIPGIVVSFFHLKDVIAYPYRLNEDIDIIVGRKDVCDMLVSCLPDHVMLAPIAVRLSTASSSALNAVRSSRIVPIVCTTERFGELLRRECEDYYCIHPAQTILFSELRESDLADADAVLIPGHEDLLCSPEKRTIIECFEVTHPVVRCVYVPDGGSMLSLKKAIDDCIKSKGTYTPFPVTGSFDSLNG